MDIRTKLCYYDTRNPDSVVFGMNEQQAYEAGYRTKSVMAKFKIECCCDNCYYGRTELAEHALLLEETLASFSN